MIPQKMRSETQIDIPGVDLRKMHNINVDLKQGDMEETLEPITVRDGSLVIMVDVELASRLVANKPVYIQVLYTDSNNVPHATDIAQIKVQQILRGGTYGG